MELKVCSEEHPPIAYLGDEGVHCPLCRAKQEKSEMWRRLRQEQQDHVGTRASLKREERSHLNTRRRLDEALSFVDATVAKGEGGKE